MKVQTIIVVFVIAFLLLAGGLVVSYGIKAGISAQNRQVQQQEALKQALR